jgi:hypothetical protein
MSFQDRDRQLLMMVPRIWGFVGAIVILLAPFQVADLPLPVSLGFWLVGIGLLYFVAKVRLGNQYVFSRRLDERYPLPE